MHTAALGGFPVTLSSLFSSSMNIDIAGASNICAGENAAANEVSHISLMTADVSRLFEQVTCSAEKTVGIIDRPGKGCDDHSLQQQLNFGPRSVVYVSCNVQTQARDIGVLVEVGETADTRLKVFRGLTSSHGPAMSKELLYLLGLQFQNQCRDDCVCLPPIQCMNTTSENVFCHMLLLSVPRF